MKSTLRCVAVLLLAIAAPACYATYTGIYWVPPPTAENQLELSDLRRSVAAAIQDFGFREIGFPEFEKETTAWVHTERTITSATGNLRGADAHVTVAVADKPLTITLRDLTNRRETDFTRALKSSLEQRLAADFGIVHLRFQRQTDILS